MGKILKLNRDLVARSMVSKSPQKAKKVRTELAKRVRHERSQEGGANLITRMSGLFFSLKKTGIRDWYPLSTVRAGGPLQLPFCIQGRPKKTLNQV